MKYRPSEQKQVNLINKNAEKLDKKAERMGKKINILDNKKCALHKAARIERNKIYDINRKVIKRCKHKKEYGRREWANCRDDASFSTYVGCGKCDEVLWDECYGPRGGYG